MNAFVLPEIFGPCKCFVTYITTVRCVTSMNAFVLLETAGLSKCFVTYITVVRSVTSMNAFVSLETLDVINALLHTSQWYGLTPV